MAIVQADLTRLPLAEGVFDLAFSIGVLHHGPDPRGAFREVARRVKPGGRLAVWLYRKNTLPQEWANSALRAVTTRLPARVLEPLCVGLGAVGGVPVLNRTLNKAGQLLEPSRLDPPGLRQFRLVRAEVPVAPLGRGAERLVRRGGLRRPRRAAPRAVGPALRLGVSQRPGHRQRRERGGDASGLREVGMTGAGRWAIGRRSTRARTIDLIDAEREALARSGLDGRQDRPDQGASARRPAWA